MAYLQGRTRRTKKRKPRERSYLARNLINYWEMRTSRLRHKAVRATKITRIRMENKKRTKVKLDISKKKMMQMTLAS